MRAWRTPLVGALALTIAATPMAPVAAAPAAPMSPSVAKAEVGSAITQVRGRHGHRHHGHRHHGHHHHRHRGIGVGIGLGVIGGIIAAESYPGYVYDEEVYDAPPPGYTGDPRILCAETFRSFEWNTGLYTTYSGEKKPCPYLK
jgi:BA14K-like protein